MYSQHECCLVLLPRLEIETQDIPQLMLLIAFVKKVSARVAMEAPATTFLSSILSLCSISAYGKANINNSINCKSSVGLAATGMDTSVLHGLVSKTEIAISESGKTYTDDSVFVSSQLNRNCA